MPKSQYVAINEVRGALVECGVWRGGSMMALALALLQSACADRPLYLFDTFSGMTEPSAQDGTRAHKKWRLNQAESHNEWCYASLEDVQRNLYSTGYNRDLIRFVVGKVEDTLPSQAPEQIALLRLDTDWYASTRHELAVIYAGAFLIAQRRPQHGKRRSL
jgi:hypothetical protein